MANPVDDQFTRRNNADFGITADVDNIGGLRVVVDTVARDNIPASHLKIGMPCVVQTPTLKMFRLVSVSPAVWVEGSPVVQEYANAGAFPSAATVPGQLAWAIDASILYLAVSGSWLSVGGGGVGNDHHSLTNLATFDDHPQYLYLNGRAGGQTASGGTAAANTLTLAATANATPGEIVLKAGSTTTIGRVGSNIDGSGSYGLVFANQAGNGNTFPTGILFADKQTDLTQSGVNVYTFAGDGADSDGVSPGTVGGVGGPGAGFGGAGTATMAAGAGGDMALECGSAGAANGGPGGNGGSLYAYAGAGTGAGINGSVNIGLAFGPAEASAINIGSTNAPTTVFGTLHLIRPVAFDQPLNGTGANLVLNGGSASDYLYLGVTPGQTLEVHIGTSTGPAVAVFVDGQLTVNGPTTQFVNDVQALANLLVVGTVNTEVGLGRPNSGVLAIGVDGGNSTLIEMGAPVQLDSQSLTIASIAYQFPVSQGGVQSVLTNDGAGNLSWGAGGSASAPYACPSNLVVGDAVYFNGNDSVSKASASSVTTAPARGFITSKPTSTTCIVQRDGELSAFSGLVANETYYLDLVSGGITADLSGFAAPNVVQRMGVARNPTTLVIEVDLDFQEMT